MKNPMSNLVRILGPAGVVIGLSLSILGLATARSSLALLGFDSTTITRVGVGVFLVAGIATLWGQQQEIKRLRASSASDEQQERRRRDLDEQKNACQRELVGLQREFMKNQGPLNDPRIDSPRTNWRIVNHLARTLREAQETLHPINANNAGEFGDLAEIMEHQDDLLRSVVAMLQTQGDTIFERQIAQLTTRTP
jgi:hypothetical protein